ncbi:MAG: hypothetical protein IKC53_04765 [Lentisphaeria bacterium]|nr:hypothetical protein [Lentisphaeria bacterium]
MAIIHILKDGTRVDDIRGHVVKIADAAPLYELIHSMNKEARPSAGRGKEKAEATEA